MKLKIPTKSTYFSSDSLSTKEMLKKIVWFINFVSYFVGCDILEPDFTIFSKRFFVCVANLFASYVLNFINIYWFREDLVRVCFCLVTLLIALQGVIKLYTFVFHRDKILSLLNRLEKIITKFNTERTNNIFEKWLMITSHVGFLATTLFLVGSFFVLIYPIIVYLFTGEKILHFGFELPWVDWKTLPGYTLNFVYSGSLVYLFIMAQISSWFLNVSFIVIIFGQFELLKVFLEDLDELLLRNEKGKNDIEIKKLIKTVTQLHNKLLG